MQYINATTLVQRADQTDFAGILPELIRRLIIASCDEMPMVTIPAGDSIYKPGVDGKCEASGGPYVPSGISYWEFGRNANYRSKCKEDFDKRTAEIAADLKSVSSFIFVTPRRWSGEQNRDAWIAERKQQSGWQDIRIYDADDLETWLGLSPSVGIWLAARLSIFTKHYESAQDYWERMTNWSDYVISPQFVLAGRTGQQQEIVNFYDQNRGLLEIQATSRSEAICFVIAALISVNTQKAQQFFANAIIVETEAALKELCAQHEHLFIIFDSGDDQSVHQQNIRTNRIIVPVSFKVKASGLTLPIPQTDVYAEGLSALGLSHSRAYALARESGKSFSVLYRIFAQLPGRVSWHKELDPTELIPLFLVQRFDEQKSGDRQIIDQLYPAGCTAYLEKLKKWSLIFDAPVYQVGHLWRVVSPYDLLYVLAGYLTEDHLKKYEAAFLTVFREPDPALQLEPQYRVAATLFKKENAYSRKMQEGLAQTLALLGSNAEEAGIQIGTGLESWVNSIVRQLLFEKRLADWQSIESRLHLLAEAAPDTFLTVLEHTLKQQPELFSSLFDDGDFTIFSPTYHTHLLWALEALAWDKNYINRVAFLLVEMVLLDTGIKIANRPINTLQSIFCVKLPQTYAGFLQRGQLLTAMARKNPIATFKLLKALSPGEHRILMPTYQPFWRLRDENPQVITWNDVIEHYHLIVRAMIMLADRNADQWSFIIELIDNYTGEMRQELLTALQGIDTFDGPVLNLRGNLQSFIHRHRQSQGKKWALPANELDILSAVYDRLTIRAIHKYTWYFDMEVIDDDENGITSMEESERRSHDKRDEALAEIIAEGGFAVLIEMAAIVKRPAILGHHAAVRSGDYADQVMDMLGSAEKYLDSFAVGYLHKCAAIKGLTWIDEMSSGYLSSPDHEKLIKFLCCTSPNSLLWDYIEKLGQDIDSKYWDQVLKVIPHFLAPEDADRCITKLNNRLRFVTAFNTMRYKLDSVSPELMIQTLEGLISHPAEGSMEADISVHSIKVIFTKLDDYPAELSRMVRLEWSFFQLLNEKDHQRPIKYLFQALCDDPEYFAQMMTWTAKPENGDGQEEIAGMAPHTVQERARNADQVIQAWYRLPGQAADGTIDFDTLHRWCKQAIDACRKKDRETLCYNRIGQIFGQLYDGTDGWPQPAICELMETFNHEEVNKGFYSGVINGHGVKINVRAVDHGAFERKKAEKFRSLASKLPLEYTIVNRLILQVALMYESHSKLIAKEDAQRE